MLPIRSLGAGAVAVLLIAGCDTTPSRGPLATMPTGTNESVLRQQQLQNIQSGANPGTQNPVVTGVNPGVSGIERAPMGGGGTVGAGTPTAVNPGTTGIVRPGVGAPMR